MAVADISRFVQSKKKWIETHLAQQERVKNIKSAFSIDYGGAVRLRGTTYPIRAKSGNRAGFDGECFYMPADLTPDGIKGAVIRIYKMVARRVIVERVSAYANHMNVTPTAIRITGAKTRWGSCSGKNSVNFSWRLIMAGDDVIDYVVVHELAHIKEHNHSPRFWAVIEKVLPDYKQRKKSLKDLQEKLSREDWDS
jgi:predicted metal-dependent hydrolase